jgi:dihydroorotase
MEILLRQARIVDPSSPFHLQTSDIFIKDGIILEIGSIDHKAEREIQMEGLCVSPGWVDCYAHFNDPGFEFKETIETGSAAAAAGGFTDVMVIPNTAPVLHSKSGIEYVVQKSRSLAVTVHPIGAVTKNAEGKELAEMYDMHQSGAVAFSDASNTIQSAGLLLKALQYLKAIDKTLIQVPGDQSVNPPGLMNEGVVSTRMGIPGKPAIAEELMVRRDIELAQYTGSKVHLTGLSTEGSVALVREAKQKGLPVTCSVTAAHLWFTDEDLAKYDTNLKVNPPFRTAKDRDALRNAVMDGTVDCIASHHLPQDKDHKVLEFEYAQYGMTALETSFAVLRSVLPQLDPVRIVELLSINPRRIFGLNAVSLAEGNAAVITLFNPDTKWIYAQTLSRSVNSPFLQKELTGKPLGIIHKDKLFLN